MTRTPFPRLHLLMLLALAALACLPAPASAADLPTGFAELGLASGLSRPTQVAWAPDGRMFVIEKDGVLKVVPAGGGAAQTVYDIRAAVNSYEDRGLLGVAVDPSFASNRFVYLLYTAETRPLVADSDSPMVARLDRITVSAANVGTFERRLLGSWQPAPAPAPTSGWACPRQDTDGGAPEPGEVADTNAVDCLPSDATSHSIGSVRFGPGRTLYVGIGDAADYNDADQLAFRTYDEEVLAGKILRVDADSGRGLPGHPFCPADANLAHNCTKLHAKGFRNPFRFTVRPDGTLAVGDVGWYSEEELDIVRSGGRSYGWPCYEGSSRSDYRSFGGGAACAREYARERTASAHVAPDYTYPHEPPTLSAAIVGGPTYTGAAYPAEYRGALFVGDYALGQLRYVELDAAGRVAQVRGFGSNWLGVALEKAPDGDLVYVDPGDFTDGSGSVKRIAYAPGTPTARASASPDNGPAPLSVSFDGRASVDPTPADGLSFSWDFGDGSGIESGPRASHERRTHTYTRAGTFEARLTVTDGSGRSDTTNVRVDPGNSRPAFFYTINGQSEDDPKPRYAGGDGFSLQASARDTETPYADLRFGWTVSLVHVQHTHVLASSRDDWIYFEATRDHGADSYYVITVTVTDGGGLTARKRFELRPRTAQLLLRSSPGGATVNFGGPAFRTPRDLSEMVGFRGTLRAAEGFTQNGRSYAFRRWTDGGAREHEIAVPDAGAPVAQRTFTAFYDDVTPPGTGGGRGGTAGVEVDRRGPAVGFDARRGVNVRRGVLSGLVSDRSGVRRVEPALALRAGRRCRWWDARRRRPAARASSCGRPRYLRAQLGRRGGRVVWTLKLRRSLPPGSYRLLVRARDGRGNLARRLSNGRAWASFKVRRR